MRLSRSFVAALFLAPLLLPAQAVEVPVPAEEERKRLVARRATGPITLDGHLDEADWRRAPVTGDFVQVRPDFVPTTAYATEVRVLFDDEHLYIGAFNRDSAGTRGLRMPDLRRDFSPPDNDVFGVTLGPLGDRRTAYQLQVTPLGSQGDVQAFDGGASFSFSWDAMWRVRTSRSDTGWVAEIAIPWASLRYAPERTAWDINFVRNTRRAAQWSAWVPYPRQFSSWRLTYSGILDSIAPPPPRVNVRSRLYGLTESERDHSPGGPRGSTAAVGGELLWAPSANAVLEATVNTDFAQADVDRQVVNLTRFSVFFPEQRQFFLENADLLSVGTPGIGGPGGFSNPFVVQPFFSRRIGLGADGSPRQITGGLRYGYRSGETAAGALVMHQTAGESDGDAAFGVVRGSRFVGRSTRLGGLVAVRNDYGPDGALNTVTAVDALTRIGELTQFAGMLSTSTRDGRTGLAGSYAIGRSTATSSVALSGAYVAADYDPRTGFVSRPNVLMTGPSASLTLQPAWRPERLVWIRPQASALVFHDPTSRRLQEASIELSTEFLGRSSAAITPFVRHEMQRPTGPISLLPGLTIAPEPQDFMRVGVNAATDAAARFALATTLSAGGFFNGTREQAALSARWSPTPYVSVRGNYEVNRLRGVGDADTSLVTHLVGPELRLSLSPRMHWSAFYQHNSVLERGTLNARFSWEFSPLSYLFVVYNERHPVLGGLEPRSQSLIVKLSWLRQL